MSDFFLLGVSALSKTFESGCQKVSALMFKQTIWKKIGGDPQIAPKEGQGGAVALPTRIKPSGRDFFDDLACSTMPGSDTPRLPPFQ